VARVGVRVRVPALPRAPQLLQLPPVYQNLFLALSRQPCHACGQRRSELALCLVCGLTMCVGEGNCSDPAERRGRCSAHAAHCGASAGVFLLAEHTQLLALRSHRACFMPSPYLDSYGEEDQGLRRGRLLSLSRARFAQASQLWAAAAVDHDTRLLATSHGRMTLFNGAAAF